MNYETPLYVQRGLVPPTPTVQTPGLASTRATDLRDRAWYGVRRYLVLRDVVGEDLESGDLYTPPFRFFANADAVLFSVLIRCVSKGFATNSRICSRRRPPAGAIRARYSTTC